MKRIKLARKDTENLQGVFIAMEDIKAGDAVVLEDEQVEKEQIPCSCPKGGLVGENELPCEKCGGSEWAEKAPELPEELEEVSTALNPVEEIIIKRLNQLIRHLKAKE